MLVMVGILMQMVTNNVFLLLQNNYGSNIQVTYVHFHKFHYNVWEYFINFASSLIEGSK